MWGVFPVRPGWRARLAAVMHVDGTARVQTVEREMAPRLHALLEEHGRRSGIPVLLNTSLNLAGEPIVNRAVEGYSTSKRWRPSSIRSSDGADFMLELLACPACEGPLDEGWMCRGCGARHQAADGVPNLRVASDARTDVVRRFYEEAPSPGYPPRDSLEWLRARARASGRD